MSKSRTSPEAPSAHGLLIVLVGPSGTGKSTILKQLFARDARMAFSVSHTTRAPRAGEVDGEAYHFVSDATFDAMVAEGAFAEWANVHGRRYGTARAEIDRLRAAGRDIVFDIDVVGALNLCRAYPDAVSVFLLPPSLAELEARLRGRGTETAENLALRLANARAEIAQAQAFRYLIVNASVATAAETLAGIVVAERHRAPLHADLPTRLLAGEPIV